MMSRSREQIKVIEDSRPGPASFSLSRQRGDTVTRVADLRKHDVHNNNEHMCDVVNRYVSRKTGIRSVC